MTLDEFLGYIIDEEIRVELQIDIEGKDDYEYVKFWLSDYRGKTHDGVKYKDYIVTGIDFSAMADIGIIVKEL